VPTKNGFVDTENDEEVKALIKRAKMPFSKKINAWMLKKADKVKRGPRQRRNTLSEELL
jgi:hypothetical protein